MKFGDHKVDTDVKSPQYVRYIAEFDNGYGLSIIWFSSWRPDHYEVALLREQFDGQYRLDWDHPDFPDVIPNLSPQEVARVLDRVKALPKTIDGEIVPQMKELES